jgi:nucleotide-binding universal stress UspA family protein
MKKIIVTTDFSETSRNAAHFAARMASDIPHCTLILYHVYDSLYSSSEGTEVHSDTASRKRISESALNNLKNELEQTVSIPIICLAEEGKLIANLEKLFHHQSMDLIVMGITGATRLEQILIGSNTLQVIQENICPVMIIPPDAVYHKIQTIVFTSDFKDVESTTPILELRKILDIFKPTLYVVNVDHEHYVELTEDYKTERAKMDKMLEGYNPEYAFIRMYDFTESINLFAEDRKADLIITVPRKHGFISNLFKTNHTKKLAYHSHLPVLAIHE